eukprot:gene9217-16361_t
MRPLELQGMTKIVQLPCALELQGMTKIVQMGISSKRLLACPSTYTSTYASCRLHSATFPAPPAPAAPFNSTMSFGSASSAAHVPQSLDSMSRCSIFMLAMRTQSALSKIRKAKRKAAYISFIGHQRANFKGVLPPAPQVSQANLLALGMALPGHPALPTYLVARLGLQNVAAVSFVQSGLGQGTGSQGGHGGMRRETGKARAGERSSQAKGKAGAKANVGAGVQVEGKKAKEAGSGKDQLARKGKNEEG